MREEETTLILCSGYCEHGKFMGECSICAHAIWCETVGCNCLSADREDAE